MPSPATPHDANESNLVVHRLNSMDQRLDGMDQRLNGMDGRLNGMDERMDRFETTLGELAVSFGKLDTKMNIVLGFLGAITSGASYLLVRLLLN